MRRIVTVLLVGIALFIGGIVAVPVTPAFASTCTATGPNGTCGPYTFTDTSNPDGYIINSNGYDTYTENNCFGDPSCDYTLTSTDPGNFSVVGSEPANNTSVKSYPNVDQLTNNWDPSTNTWDGSGLSDTPIASLSSYTSTFSETMPHNSGTIAEAGYDIWTNYSDDIMVWTDTVNRCNSNTLGTQIGTATIDSQHFDVYRLGGTGGEIIFVLNGAGGSGTCAQETSGTVNILGVLNWMQNHGYASNMTVSSIDFGWEISSTGGTDETFSVSKFILTGTPGTNTGLGIQQAPDATTIAANNVNSSTATLNGSVNPENGSTTYQFDYGTTTSYGNTAPAGGASAGSDGLPVLESQNITGLSANTTYHYRIEATNSGGTSYGSDQTFTTTNSAGYQLISKGAVDTTGHPSFGQATQQGNLLVAWATSNDSSSTFPITVSGSGWTLAARGGGSYGWTGLWYKANSSASETAPTFSDAGASTLTEQLTEYSGGLTVAPLDQTGSGFNAVTASGADTAPSDLVVSVSTWNGSNPSPTLSMTQKGSQGTALAGSYTSGNSANPLYIWGWSVNNGTLGTSADSVTPSSSLFENNASTVIASFKPAGYQLVSKGAVDTTGHPSFGQATQAGDLLVAWATSNDSSSTFPITVSGSGWTLATSSGGPYGWTGLWYKANSSAGETAPTFSDANAPTLTEQLAEFSGGATSSPLDQTGSGFNAITASGVDTASSDLVISITTWNGSNPSPTLSMTQKGSQGTALAGSYTSGNSANPLYIWGWSVNNATLGTSADSVSPSSSLWENNGVTALASFKPEN